MKNFVTLIVTGFLLAVVVISQTLSRYSENITPFLNLFSEKDGIWYKARVLKEPTNVESISWLVNDDVLLTRSASGVVHIQAKNENDAYIAWGYTIARDRFVQLQFLKKAASGRLSELFGANAASADAAFMSLGLEYAAQREMDKMSEDEFSLLRAFTNGVNLYLSGLSEKDYPLEVRMLHLPVSYWRPLDCLLIIKLWEYTNSFDLTDLEKQLIAKQLDSSIPYERLYGVSAGRTPEKEPGLDVMEMYKKLFAEQKERDKWLLKPDRTVSDFAFSLPASKTQRGNPVFGGNLAGSFTFPGLLYEIQISTPRMQAYGFSLCGAPVLISGFSPHLAWSFSRPSKPVSRFFYTDSESPDLNIKAVTSKWTDVNGSARSGMALLSDIGPVFRSPSSELALRWPGFYSREMVAFTNRLSLAKTVTSLGNEQTFPVSGAHFNLSDSRGGAVSRQLFHASDDANDGLLALRPVHVSFNPALKPPLSVDKNPRRLEQLLEAKSRHSIEEMQSYLTDNAINLPGIRKLIVDATRSTREKEWSEIRADLQVWNMRSDVESKLTPLTFSFVTLMRKYVWDEFYDLVNGSFPADEVWIDLALNEPNHPVFDNGVTPQRESARDIIDNALRDALNLNIIDNGPYNSWSWGEINKVKPVFYGEGFIGPLYELNPIPYEGFYSSLAPSIGKNPVQGITLMLLVEFRNGVPAAFVNHLGTNVSLPDNGSVQSMADIWAKKQFRAIQFQSESNPVEGNRLTLKPALQ